MDFVAELCHKACAGMHAQAHVLQVATMLVTLIRAHRCGVAAGISKLHSDLQVIQILT